MDSKNVKVVKKQSKMVATREWGFRRYSWWQELYMVYQHLGFQSYMKYLLLNSQTYLIIQIWHRLHFPFSQTHATLSHTALLSKFLIPESITISWKVRNFAFNWFWDFGNYETQDLWRPRFLYLLILFFSVTSFPNLL